MAQFAAKLPGEGQFTHPPDDGPVKATDVLSASLYPELKRLAQSKMRWERADHTLQATALINELYLRLLKHPDFTWRSRNEFLVSASRAMRNLLVDHAREKHSHKRGRGWVRVDMEYTGGIQAPDSEQILDIDDLLRELAREEPRMAQVVELKFFGGLSFVEIGAALDIHERTAKRDWTLARAWLAQHLGGTNSDERGGMGTD